MYQFKAKDSEMKICPFCLGSISKDVTLNNMKKTMFKGSVTVFSVDFNAINTSNILDIHKYLLKETWYEMFEFLKKIFIGLLTSIVNVSNHTKCVYSSNQKCTTQPALINLHPD